MAYGSCGKTGKFSSFFTLGDRTLMQVEFTNGYASVSNSHCLKISFGKHSLSQW